MRDQEATRSDEKILLHQPRRADQSAAQAKPGQTPDVRADERKASS